METASVDLFVTHLSDEKHRCGNRVPVRQFRDRTVAAGLTSRSERAHGFGTVLADFDHDGAPETWH